MSSCLGDEGSRIRATTKVILPNGFYIVQSRLGAPPWIPLHRLLSQIASAGCPEAWVCLLFYSDALIVYRLCYSFDES